MKKTMKAHIERVSWQVQRIYRTRNLIIHSGKSVPYIDILVENLHSYLDRIINVLNEKISHSKHPTTIEQCVLEVKLASESHLRKLENFGCTKCSKDNFLSVLFGH